jgi:hypothetical protein
MGVLRAICYHLNERSFRLFVLVANLHDILDEE